MWTPVIGLEVTQGKRIMSLSDYAASAVWLIALSVASTTGGAFAFSKNIGIMLERSRIVKQNASIAESI